MNTQTGNASPQQTPRTLYMRLSEQGMCFARYEARRETYFSFSPFPVRQRASLAVNLREALQAEEILQAPVEHVQVLVSTPAIPVPLADFQEEDCETIYNYCFTPDARRRVFYDAVSATSTVLLFALEEMTCHVIEDAFNSNVHYISATTPVLKHFATKGNQGEREKRLFIYCHEQTAEIFLFEESRLIALNAYSVQAPTDVAFYAFNLACMHAANLQEAPVYVACNEQALKDAICTELQKYAANVRPVNPGAEFNRHIVAVTPAVPYDLINLLIS